MHGQPDFPFLIILGSQDGIVDIRGPDVQFHQKGNKSVLLEIDDKKMNVDNGTEIGKLMKAALSIVDDVGTAYEDCMRIFNGSHAVHLHLRASFFLSASQPEIDTFSNGDCKVIRARFKKEKVEGILLFSKDENSFVRIRNVSAPPDFWNSFCNGVQVEEFNENEDL